jgi:tetratricopeptide (TPR) repeat protein
VLRQLALHYADWSMTGVLDHFREKESRERAIELYERYLAAHPDDSTALTQLSRLLVRSERFEEAVKRLEPLTARPDCPTAAALWHLEALFRLGRFQEMRALAAAHRENFEQADQLTLDAAESAVMWSKPDAALEAIR